MSACQEQCVKCTCLLCVGTQTILRLNSEGGKPILEDCLRSGPPLLSSVIGARHGGTGSRPARVHHSLISSLYQWLSSHPKQSS